MMRPISFGTRFSCTVSEAVALEAALARAPGGLEMEPGASLFVVEEGPAATLAVSDDAAMAGVEPALQTIASRITESARGRYIFPDYVED
jgi:hypothetical protein